MEATKSTFDIVFVSAYGRHHWLAQELAKNEWQVGHIDVSSLLGSWSQQDLKNPFGLSKIQNLDEKQTQAWLNMAQAQKISNGVSLLFSNGPFEGSGPLRDFYKSQLNFQNEVEEFLKLDRSDLNAQALSKLDSKIKKLSFEDLWLVNLSRQLAASIYIENAKAQNFGLDQTETLPIFEDLFKDQSTSETRSSDTFFKKINLVKNYIPQRVVSAQKSKDRNFELSLDMAFEGGAKSSGPYAQKLESRVLIWALTSAETEFLSKDAAQFLFEAKIIEPAWSWQRFSWRGPVEVLERWPSSFYCLDHLRLPWTHENLTLISKKSVDTFDVWLRLPCIFRFNADYQFKISEVLKKKLEHRFVSNDFECLELSTETKFSKEQLGPPRWPMYLAQDIERLKPIKHPYLIFESCENLKTHQIQAQLVFQNNLFEKLTLMRKEWLAVEAKIKQRAIDREISKRK